MIQGLIILNYPDYEPQLYHGAFLAWAVIAVSIFVNTVIAGLLPILEGLILLVHILGFIAILITLVYLSPHGSAEDVFFRSLNEGNWPTQGLSYCVGFIGNVATFVGKYSHLFERSPYNSLLLLHDRSRCSCPRKYSSQSAAKLITNPDLPG